MMHARSDSWWKGGLVFGLMLFIAGKGRAMAPRRRNDLDGVAEAAAREAAKAAQEAVKRVQAPAQKLVPRTQVVAPPAPEMDTPDRASQAAPEQAPPPPVAKRQCPEGTDLDAARREAVNVARHLFNAGGGYELYKSNPRKWAENARGNYARRLILSWQAKACLKPDGIYGPLTANALRALGAPNAPPSLFRKRKDGTYWDDSDPRAQYTPPY